MQRHAVTSAQNILALCHSYAKHPFLPLWKADSIQDIDSFTSALWLFEICSRKSLKDNVRHWCDMRSSQTIRLFAEKANGSTINSILQQVVRGQYHHTKFALLDSGELSIASLRSYCVVSYGWWPVDFKLSAAARNCEIQTLQPSQSYGHEAAWRPWERYMSASTFYHVDIFHWPQIWQRLQILCWESLSLKVHRHREEEEAQRCWRSKKLWFLSYQNSQSSWYIKLW